MTSRTRVASPKPAAPSDVTASIVAKEKAAEAVKFVPPPRPAGLRESLLKLYSALAAAVLVWAIIGQGMLQPVPEGKFLMKNGSIIDIDRYDASDLGPYPKCHPRHEQHRVVHSNGTEAWVKNSDAPTGGPYPVGHPENPEWVKKSDERTKAENKENRFKWKGLQANFHLLILATLTVILGCKHGVWLFTEPAVTRVPGPQVLQSDDVYWFPVLGSGMLFGLFLVFKYLDTNWIKMFITCWIVMVCTAGIAKNTEAILAVIRKANAKASFTIPYFKEEVTLMELVGGCIGVCMAVCYVYSKNWVVNNVFGLSFCLLGIRMVGLSSVKVGAIMLIGLFFYDVFWVFGSKSVFGSNVMVSVATGVEAPIKLMFPRELGGCGTLRHSMLGLGDIAVPGIFMAFLAKWDAVKIGEKASDSFIYLNSASIAYFFSLVTTVSVMLFFNAAQPALLYIVPYVLVTTTGVALWRGELKALWAYEIPDEEGPSDAKNEDKKTN